MFSRGFCSEKDFLVFRGLFSVLKTSCDSVKLLSTIIVLPNVCSTWNDHVCHAQLERLPLQNIYDQPPTKRPPVNIETLL